MIVSELATHGLGNDREHVVASHLSVRKMLMNTASVAVPRSERFERLFFCRITAGEILHAARPRRLLTPPEQANQSEGSTAPKTM